MEMEYTMKFCSVRNCLNFKEEHKYFNFPPRIEHEVLKKWIAFCGDKSLTKVRGKTIKRYICDMHFEDKCFDDPSSRSKLRRNAVPTLHGPPEVHQLIKEFTISDEVQNVSHKGCGLVSDHTYCVDTQIFNQNATTPEVIVVHEDPAVLPEREPCNINTDNWHLKNKSDMKSANVPSLLKDTSKIQSGILDTRDTNSSSINDSQEKQNSTKVDVPDPHHVFKTDYVFHEEIINDLHFCGECKKMFDSFEKYLVHKLTDEQYKMAFETSSTISGLWLPKLCKKNAGDIVSEESGSEGSTSESEDSSVVGKTGFDFQCRHCGRYFLKEEKLKLHLRKDHEMRGYVCPPCGMNFGNKGYLIRHYFKNHANTV